jgi:4-hydroxy-2-oxoheptanedioate aldolase
MDFAILDMEHGPADRLCLEELIRAAECAGLVSVVRAPEGDLNAVAAALDLGADGVQVPQVTTAEEARAVVRRARFAPLGERGVCRYVRAARYSTMERSAYFREANRALLVLQVEGERALDQIDAILDVEGFDILFVGPYDLSQSLGVPGEVDHPRVVGTVERIVAQCAQRGRVVGTFVESVETARFWRERGVGYLAYSVDVGLLAEAVRSVRDGVFAGT